MLSEETIKKHLNEFEGFYELIQRPIKNQLNGDLWLILKQLVNNETPLFLLKKAFPRTLGKNSQYLLKRVCSQEGFICKYSLQKKDDLPGEIVFRIGQIELIESFLNLEAKEKDLELTEGTFAEIDPEIKERRFSLPREKKAYQQLLEECLRRSVGYYRSTGFFNSGVLKIYQEPIQQIVLRKGEIKLLVDWQGFTNHRDLENLGKLEDASFRETFLSKSIEEFLQKLDDKDFDSTELMCELIKHDFMEIKMVKMQNSDFAIFHSKTGILVDSADQKILHEGSANFTTAAESKNSETITFFYSDDSKDSNTIEKAYREFNEIWNNQSPEHLCFSIKKQFVEHVLKERARRKSFSEPKIDSFMPDEITAGEVQRFKVEGENLSNVEQIEFPQSEEIIATIHHQDDSSIEGELTIPEDTNSSKLEVVFKSNQGKEYKSRSKPTLVKKKVIKEADFSELLGYEDAISQIIEGNHGSPTKDFLLWITKQNPNQFTVDTNSGLDEWVDQSILYPHQKDGALLCWKRMNLFGMAVCADSVGLGKTRLSGAVIKLARDNNKAIKVAIVAARKYWDNWKKDLTALGFLEDDYELFNKNLMGVSAERFKSEFSKFGGADLVIIDEAHEGIRNYKNTVHKTCLEIRDLDKQKGKKRLYLLLTATPWNNRREDIYNILCPFISNYDGLRQVGLSNVIPWLEHRENVSLFTDTTDLFRQTYREIFVQRTRKMLREAAPGLSLYAKREAHWLPVNFESQTETALSEIFDKFETELIIPFAQPIQYFSETGKAFGLSKNMRRFFLQRADSSMYALRRTIKSFIDRTKQMLERLESRTSSVDDLESFLLEHYGFPTDSSDYSTQELIEFDEEFFEEEDLEDEDAEIKRQEIEEKRRKLRTVIDNAIAELRKKEPSRAKEIYLKMIYECENDIERLEYVESLLAKEYILDHKREKVTQKVKELISKGQKVLLISTYADTVLDYFYYFSRHEEFAKAGIGCVTGTRKAYFVDDKKSIAFDSNTLLRPNEKQPNISKRSEVFKLFAPDANCRPDEFKPLPSQQINILIGSETLSVGQNLQDADNLINIDLPWNPMILEQRIGRIDRPKQHKANSVNIFYANSESQLIKQASKLSSLHKKLTGETEIPEPVIYQDMMLPSSSPGLGASIYGDTSFDEEVLPGYIEFIENLVKARNSSTTQDNFQEKVYEKQETFESLVTQMEIQYYEQISKILKDVDPDYEPKPFSFAKNNNNDAQAVLVILVKYLDPNGLIIDEKEKILFWNDATGTKNGFGKALELSINSPAQSNIFQSSYVWSKAGEIYKEFIKFKKQLIETEISYQDANKSSIKSNSERLNQIQNRISNANSLPIGITPEQVLELLSKVNEWKNQKRVVKLLQEFTSPDKQSITDEEFIRSFVDKADALGLMGGKLPKIESIETELKACLIRL